ncbi:MAG: TrkA family potassium uptake protein [Planctomycetes bacterium]|nr:TrkA family potassium uptake protein [Planctomycetota bacterium]
MKVLLVGGGRVIQFVTQRFVASGHAVTVIVRSPSESARLARHVKATVVRGDGTDAEILEEAGARACDVVLAATPSDADNLVACHTARAKFAVPRIVALVNDPDNREVFRALGVEAISTALTIASLIEQQASLDHLTELIPAAGGQVQLTDVRLPKDSSVVGRKLAELGIPRDALIAVVMRDGRVLVPRGDTVLEEGDHVLLVSLADARTAAITLLQSRTR